MHGWKIREARYVVAAGIGGIIRPVVGENPHHQVQAGRLIQAAGGNGDGIHAVPAKKQGGAAIAAKATLDLFGTAVPVQRPVIVGDGDIRQTGAGGVPDAACYTPAAFAMAFHHLPHGPGNGVPDPATMAFTRIVCRHRYSAAAILSANKVPT